LASDSIWDVIVIGAGAAGMMAAVRCGQLGCRTLLLEKNRKPGVKILMSGGTRCNLTHNTDAQGILDAFGQQGRFLRTALYELDPHAVVRLFHDIGVPTKIEATGKVFPTSDRALDVQRALWNEVRKKGVEAVLEQAVERLDRERGVWHVTTSSRCWHGRRLIVTTGGCSYPGCGTRGDAYAWMAQLGHTIVTPRPALVPLTSADRWISELSGVTLDDVLVRVLSADLLQRPCDLAERLAICRKKCLAQRRSSLLFTHFGVSGPAAMDVSREVTARADPKTVRLVCDLLPAVSAEDLQDRLQRDSAASGARSVGRWLSTLLPHRLADSLVQQAGLEPDQRLAELGKSARRTLVERVKTLEIIPTGSRGMAKAEVTDGGVDLSDVDPRSMASKRADDLFIAGELLDVDGPIGGYNFQAAFSTGWLAGSAASG
jgi:predicted Rossmann fold flavoprotein